MNDKNLCDDCLNAIRCPMQAGIVRTRCAVHKAKSTAVVEMANVFVLWEWLERYAAGKRCNFCSDFVADAKRALVREVKERFEKEVRDEKQMVYMS